MKMIRWRGLAAFVVVVGLIAVFNLLFLDGIIKNFIEDQASLVAGAKVEIGKLNLKIFGLRLDIRDLQVANPNQPMRNSVEVGSLAFDLGATPLLYRRVAIDRMEVTGLALDTPRKTSGALPPRLLKKLEKRKALELPEVRKIAEKKLEECVLPDFAALRELSKRTPADLLAGVELESSSFLQDYQRKVEDVRQSWKKRIADLPDPKEIEKNFKELQSLTDQRPRDLTQLPAYLEKINSQQQKLNKIRKNLSSAQQQFQADMSRLRTSLEDVEKLKEQDLKRVLTKLGIQAPSGEDLICVLVGREMAQKANGAISWYRKLRAFMPAGGGEEKEKREEPRTAPRWKGVDVQFPLTRKYPAFLLREAVFSTRQDGLKESKYRFATLEGQLRGLTTDPGLYGEPTRLRVEGTLAEGLARLISLSAILDHRRSPVDDQIDLRVQGLRVQPKGPAGSDGSPLRLASAILEVNGSMRARGEELRGRVRLGIGQPQVHVGPKAAVLEGLFKNMGPFDVALEIGGTLEQPSLGLSSSATQILSSGLQKIVSTQSAGVQEEVRKAIASRVGPQTEASKRELGTLEGWIRGELESRLKFSGK
jgi:uncharacterized protein (TIGR03545 family)